MVRVIDVCSPTFTSTCSRTSSSRGNQLAVYLDPPLDLPTTVMQAIAREMAFSETTFVFPADTRPGPTVASGSSRRPASCRWPAIPRSGRRSRWRVPAASRDGRHQPCSREGVGPIPIDLEWADADLRFAWMTQRRPSFGPSLARLDTLASAARAGGGRPGAGRLAGAGGIVRHTVPDRSRRVACRSGSRRGRTPAPWLGRSKNRVAARAASICSRSRAGLTRRMYTRGCSRRTSASRKTRRPVRPADRSVRYLVRHGQAARGGRPIRNLQGVRMGRPELDTTSHRSSDGDDGDGRARRRRGRRRRRRDN